MPSASAATSLLLTASSARPQADARRFAVSHRATAVAAAISQ